MWGDSAQSQSCVAWKSAGERCTTSGEEPAEWHPATIVLLCCLATESVVAQIILAVRVLRILPVFQHRAIQVFYSSAVVRR